ncbi:hypothetical protein D9M68_412040 [compost metagenome]
MKTSNKLLIAFAAALILIPLLGMVYVSQVYYTTGNYKTDEVVKIENFSTPTKNMSSMAITSPFESVNIADAKGMSLNIHLINDDNFGLKIPENVKDLISASVDANGQLQIVAKGKPNHQDYVVILIYAPSFKQLDLAQSARLIVSAKADSLSLNVSQTEGIRFNNEIQLNKLSLFATNVGEISVNADQIKSMALNLKHSNFKSQSNSFDNLSISTSGESKIEIYGNDENDSQYTIKNLALKTLDQTAVKIEDIKISNCSGSFSDQTKVQMPAVNLNQMYKK